VDEIEHELLHGWGLREGGRGKQQGDYSGEHKHGAAFWLRHTLL
jgi:hypothetical protein